MGVGTAEAERRHTRAAQASGVGPVGRLGDDLQPKLVERNVGVGILEVQIRRDGAALHRKGRLDQTGDTRSRLQVPEVGLDSAGQQRRIGLAAAAIDRPEGAGFDRIAEQRAGSVRLDVVDFGWLQSRVGARGAQYGGLGGRVRCHQAVGPSVLIDRRTAHHGEHPVTIAERVGEPLEDGDAAPLATDESVGRRVEGMAGTGRRHGFGRIETARHHRREDQVHPAGDREVRLTGAQALACQVHRDQ